MRDFRDAKIMARTLRSALAAKGLKITVSQSLELIAELFDVDDWNTLAAAIRREESTPREDASPDQFRQPTFSRELELTLHRTLGHADQRNHEYATLEHLLLALIDDPDASAVMKACMVDLGSLKERLTGYIDNELKDLVIANGGEPKPTTGFQRVMQQAEVDAQRLGRGGPLTGAQVLVAIFPERESHAAYFLQEQEMTRDDAIGYISHRDHLRHTIAKLRRPPANDPE
jgi:hypothetical protein